MNWKLRPANMDDAGFVAGLEEICMAEYARALWGDWIPSVTKYGFAPERHRIVEVDGVCAGCLDVWQHEDHHDLDKLYLLPEFQNRGLGSELLKFVVAQAHEKKFPLRLSVLTSNQDALRFYKRFPFEIFEKTNERIVMEWV